MYGIEPIFWIKLFLSIGIFAFLLFVFNSLMRKYLKVEKRKIFSYNHVNEKHRKIDWTIRISFVIITLTPHFFIIRNISKNISQNIWYPEIWFSILVFFIISEMVRAFMEWKYAENQKAYIFTISQLIFILILQWVLFSANFSNI